MRARHGFLGCGLLAVACLDSTEPSILGVSGAYAATEFVVGGGVSGIERDYLAAGARISLTLSADGTTKGSMNRPIPGGLDTTSLVGRWSLRDSTVTLSLDAPTLIAHLVFVVRGTELFSSQRRGDLAVRVRLGMVTSARPRRGLITG